MNAAPVAKRRAVRLLACNLRKLNVREWGQPSGPYVGRMWRSERQRSVTCCLPCSGGRLRIDTRAVLVVDHVEDQWVPAAWRAALAACRVERPWSALRLYRVGKGVHRG